VSARNSIKCPNSAQPVECPVCVEFNEVSGLRHAKVSRDFARAISHARFRTRNFARFRRGKLMSRNGSVRQRCVDAASHLHQVPSLQVSGIDATCAPTCFPLRSYEA
jgi:hypothetical protein